MEARAGSRQRVCGAEGCQRERRRRNAARWREAHREAFAEAQLRGRLEAKPPPSEAAAAVDPMARLSGVEARIAVGSKTWVVLEEVAKVLLWSLRIGVPPKPGGVPGRSPKEIPRGGESRSRLDALGGTPSP